MNLLRKLRFSCISKSSSPPTPMVSYHTGLKVVFGFISVFTSKLDVCIYISESVFRL